MWPESNWVPMPVLMLVIVLSEASLALFCDGERWWARLAWTLAWLATCSPRQMAGRVAGDERCDGRPHGAGHGRPM